MRLTTTFLLLLGISVACGHDERLDPNAIAGSSGGVAGIAGAAGATGGGGTPSGGGSNSDAAADSPADSSADSPTDALADADASVGDAGSDGADGSGDGDGAVAAIVPDFSLADENPASNLYKKQVSPRDYLGQISAWYFGHAT